MAKRMRLPNGFGQISELKGRRLRNKWRAMVTIGWTDEGKPKRKMIGYFHTYNEAYQNLMKYHENPYEFDNDMDMLELYETWSEKHYPTIKNPAPYKTNWKYCESIYSMKVKDIRARHINGVIESEMPPSAHRIVKLMLIMMLNYAVENDIVDKNYAKIASAKTDKYNTTKHHIPFTDDELETLWKHQDLDVANLMLIDCYTGFRPQELLSLKTANVDLDNWIIVGGMKTAAGKDRIVPIHDRIKPLVEQAYDPNSEHLFNMIYATYKRHFSKVRDLLSMDPEHKPHDCRTTFITNMKRAEANDFAIKRMVGHAIDDVTEYVYTKRDTEWLRAELMKLP